MEFDSTPGDSCSISRRDNVWSEATSSESVEMLLKSVGQEETMPDKSIIQEPNACDDHGTLAKNVESVINMDEKSDRHAANSEAVHEDEFLKDGPASKMHVEEELPEFEAASPTLVSGEGGASDERKRSFQDDNLIELKAFAVTSMSSGAGEDSLHVADGINYNAGAFNTLEGLELVNADISQEGCNDGREKHVSTSKGLEDSKSSEGMIGEASEANHTVCSSFCSVKELGGLNNQDTVGVRLDCVREAIEGESLMRSSERDDRNALYSISTEKGKHELEKFPARSMVGPFEGFLDGSTINGLDKHSAEVGSLDAGQFASPEQKRDHCLSLASRADGDKLEDLSLSSVESDSIAKMPIFHSDDKKIPVESSSYNNETNASESSDMPMFSSAVGDKQTENVEGCHKDSVAPIQEPGELLVFASKNDSKQVTEEKLANKQVDFSKLEQDICKIKERDEKQPTTKNAGSLITDEMTESLDLSKRVIVNNDRKLQHQTAGKMELDNDVDPYATSRTAAILKNDPENGEGEAAVIESSHPDNDCTEAAARVESGANVSTELDSVVQVKDSMAYDAAGIPSAKMAAEPPRHLNKSNDTVSKSPSMEDMNSICSNHPRVDVGCSKSSLKESVDTDLVSGRNQDIVTMKADGEKESAQAAELDKTSCGSPTIISSSEPSQMDKEQEETEGSVTTDKIIEGSQSVSENAKSKDALGDDTSFTFKVNVSPDTAEGEPGTGRNWSPVPNADKCKSSVVTEEASPSVKGKAARTPSKKNPRQSARVSDGEPVDGTPKGTSERKGRRASAKGVTKENPKKGKKEMGANQESAAVKGAKSSTTRLSKSSGSPHVQFGMTQPYGLIEQSNTKLSSAVAALHLSTNNASPSASFRPPFTDLQQVQLRAQIFVYGSLIQGTAPDEACMASAFGSSDGGRSIWEPVWRAAVERVRIQKSNSAAPETPLLSQSGARASDSAVKESSLSNKVLPSPVGRSNSKGTPAAVVNPIIPLSSPPWSNSTPFRDSLPSNVSHKVPTLDYPHTVTPLHAYQTPPIKNFVGQTSWPQTCVPGPWLASPQTSTFNSSICFQPVSMIEPVKLTPAKGASGQLTSGIKHVTTCSASHTVEASRVQEGVSALPDSKPNATSEKLSMDSKPRKRKKVSGSNQGEVSLLSEARSEPVVVSYVATNLSLPVAVPAPAPAIPVPSILNKAAGDALTVCPVDHLKQGNMDTAAAATCSEETTSNVAEAKNHAENAATLAAAAIGHSENLWSQLAKQKESGLTTEAEVKLASASVAIAAAASVAKAAAAAAKVAYTAALQAKQMADEAFLSSKVNGSGRSSVDMHDIGNATPVSILKDANITNQSNSILVAAKEAAKKRVEAATAASKQAENLDAIVKAAELAAAAVSQAGKIVAMGEPLPLSDLMEAGPEGYWKSPHPPQMAEKLPEKNEELTSTSNLGEGAILPAKVSNEHLVERGGSETRGHGKTCPSEKSDDPLDGHASLADATMEPMHGGDRELKSSRDSARSETARSSGVVSQLDSTPRTGTAQLGPDESPDSVPEDGINEGSVVEVFKHGGGLKSAWYSANVLRLEDGKAYVCYTDLLSEEGSANLCEWVPLEGEGDTAPVIRAAHPSTTLPFQATRKRRRAALGDYAWSVGDRVDVWIDDCWWEGVVTEKNEKDETTLKVHFPAQGETSTVRAWNLRTSRSWKDGKWVEWSSSRGNNASEQSDTPQEKRQKLGSAAAPTDQEDMLANDMDSGSVQADEPKLLAFSTCDRTFNVGKATREDKKHAAQRPLRSGQQKEGSKVIFGVPKPGKKRKFMEVSKHFPANRIDKSSETNDSVKFAKYLMPQATASRGWKPPSRNDSKEKRTAESRSRAPSSRKPNRTLTQRDNLNATLAQGNDKSTDNRNEFEESVIHDENQSEKLVAPGSSACEEAPEAPLSSLLANTVNVPSRKPSSSNTRSERVNKGKLAPSVGKLSKIVEEKVHNGNAGNSVTEVTEPRRSNRRIQPTHRLLEGLQSSMIIPKMPSVSHDRGPRNQSGNASAKGK